jgi:hypothetical protein
MEEHIRKSLEEYVRLRERIDCLFRPFLNERERAFHQSNNSAGLLSIKPDLAECRAIADSIDGAFPGIYVLEHRDDLSTLWMGLTLELLINHHKAPEPSHNIYLPLKYKLTSLNEIIERYGKSSLKGVPKEPDLIIHEKW